MACLAELDNVDNHVRIFVGLSYGDFVIRMEHKSDELDIDIGGSVSLEELKSVIRSLEEENE